MDGLAGKVAIVTGASRGIGRAIAERLGREGASVVVNYARSADAAQEVVAAVEGSGGRALAVQADMGRVADVRRLFQEAVDRFDRLDVLVNNAGVGLYKPVAEATEDDFDRVFDLNARGTFFALQEAARHMESGGRIVSISSGETMWGNPGSSLYAGSKAAVERFAKALAKEVGGRGITVNAVSPGFTDTEALAANPQYKEMGAALSPFGRIGQPEEVAEVVAFLVSEEAGWVTGQNIQANGGAL